MNNSMNRLSCLLGVFVVTLLSACGGGSDGGSSAVVPVNTAPSFVSSGAFSVVEGSLAVGSVEVKDLESGSNGVSQSVQGGADASHFSITSAGALSFSTAADFESPSDNDSDNVYEVTGTLTIKGIKKPITLTFEQQDNRLIGTTSLYTSDFDIQIKDERTENKVSVRIELNLGSGHLK